MDSNLTLSTTVNRNDYTPYYIQVKHALQEYINSCGWQVGDQLPGEPELCRMFEVSRTVIRQALKELELEGLIFREKGKGTFVAEPKIDQRMAQELTGFYQDMIQHGLTPVTQILKQRVIPAPSNVAAYLNLEPDADVIQIHRLRGVQHEFLILDTTYLPYALCPKVLDADFTSQSLYAFLEDQLGLSIIRAHRTLEAVLATEYEAQLLQIKVGDPLILLDSVAYLNDDTPIEYFHALHRGGRSRFKIDLIRLRSQ
jgi:GntR family transcriptional regulator